MSASRRLRRAQERQNKPKLVALPSKCEIPSPALILLMPTRGNPTIETLKAVSNTDGIPTLFVSVARKGVIDARNELARTALRVPDEAPFTPRGGWYVLWADDDAFWGRGTVLKMLSALQNPKVDIACGWFGGREAFALPSAQYADGASPNPGTTVEDGALCEVYRHGFHFVAHKLSLLSDLGPNPFTLAGTLSQKGEDFAFCERVRNAGKRLWCVTDAMVAHIGDDGTAYIPGEPAGEVVGTVIIQKDESPRDYGVQA